MIIDLTSMPTGGRYEDRYGAYLSIFREIVLQPPDVEVEVRNAPWSWLPLLYHLNCDVVDARDYFETCFRVRLALTSTKLLTRTDVEVLCSYRPETADALWKVDMQWASLPGRVRQYEPSKEFIVTTNGAYHRREVLDYLHKFDNWAPSSNKCVLVPCAADKPYPSPMHQAVLDRLPKDYYIMNATGVLGLVPQELWPEMPHYDSGIPNEWRLYTMAKGFFSRFPHDRVVVYCDYYSVALHNAFQGIGMLDKTTFVLPVKFYYDYEDLLHPSRLLHLERALSSR